MGSCSTNRLSSLHLPVVVFVLSVVNQRFDSRTGGLYPECAFMFWIGTVENNAMRRVFIAGFAIWLAASIVLRFIGQYVLRPESPTAIAILLVSSFPLMALVTRRICADANIPREQWPAAVIALVMPSLILDTFSAIFFTTVYPNISPPAAGLFAGWILWCCGGALLGVTFDDEESRAAARSDKPRLVALAHEDAAAAESARR